MKLDRAYQRSLLEQLAESYPKAHDFGAHFEALDEAERAKFRANIAYLEEHGLVDRRNTEVGGVMFVGGPRITHIGMDFLADDGGLSAILGTVTVKLHADTIRELVIAKVESAPLPPEQKSKVKQHLQAMSSEALKALTKSLVEKGLQNVPDVAQWLQALPLHL
ncbi:hypothetical protein [Ralstonia pseudosolanacearum]|uniref:hypothetical protein n=1 Tax=Ralstonia pseudosolanacearum TaxID=1310165 RepID=UPI003CEFEEED